jgi:hypothetical protein
MEQSYLVYGGLAFTGGILLSVSIRSIPLSMMKIISSLFFELWAILQGVRYDEDDILGSGFIPLH